MVRTSLGALDTMQMGTGNESHMGFRCKEQLVQCAPFAARLFGEWRCCCPSLGEGNDHILRCFAELHFFYDFGWEVPEC